jgi:glycosyltransferase involved in cell wall biosynthesis
LRVLIATDHLQIVGGVETYLQSLLPELERRGFSLGILHGEANEVSGEKISDLINCPIWSFGNRSFETNLNNIQKWGPNVVYCHGLRSPAIESVLLDNWPVFLYAHNHNNTCVSGSKRTRFPSNSLCDRSFGLSCLGYYFPRGCGGNSPLTALRMYSVVSSRKRLLNRYQKVFVASNWMAKEYQANMGSPDKIQILPYFPPNSEPDNQLPGSRSFSNTVLFAGRLVREKGLKNALIAIRTASKVLGRSLRLCVAGQGPELEKMQSLASREEVAVDWLGWIGRPEMKELMRKADLLLMPSLWAEPFGLLGIEAGCVGLPTVGHRVGGMSDWLIPGETGECGPEGSMRCSDLIDALVRALRDPEHLQKLRLGAWIKSHEFSLEKHLTSLCKNFLELGNNIN